jgi:hypothetical protein
MVHCWELVHIVMDQLRIEGKGVKHCSSDSGWVHKPLKGGNPNPPTQGIRPLQNDDQAWDVNDLQETSQSNSPCVDLLDKGVQNRTLGRSRGPDPIQG